MLGIKWEDLGAAYNRMQGRNLFQVKARPDTMAGVLLTLATMAHARRRGGRGPGAGELLLYYAAWKSIPLGQLVEGIERYWERCGHWHLSAVEIVEELSR